jgi:hypothetical protein
MEGPRVIGTIWASRNPQRSGPKGAFGPKRRSLQKAAGVVAVKKDPVLWQRCRREAIARMGGVFSARAMQLATRLYKARGGEYEGPKRAQAERNSLARWTAEDWGYAGKPRQSRYLPKAVRDRLTPSERARTNRAKRSATGQWSRQPKDVAAKAALIRRKLWDTKKANRKPAARRPSAAKANRKPAARTRSS